MEDRRSVSKRKDLKKGTGDFKFDFFNKANNFALKMFLKQKHRSVFLQMKA